MRPYTSKIHNKKPSKKAVKFERVLTLEDVVRIYDRYEAFADSLGVEYDYKDTAYDKLKTDLEKIFDMDTLFEALDSEIGIGFVLGTVVTYRALRSQGILNDDFGAEDEYDFL